MMIIAYLCMPWAISLLYLVLWKRNLHFIIASKVQLRQSLITNAIVLKYTLENMVVLTLELLDHEWHRLCTHSLLCQL